LFIKVDNAYKYNPIIANDKFVSIKNGEYHGYGLQNVHKCAVKYNGTLECNFDRNMFTVSVVLHDVISL